MFEMFNLALNNLLSPIILFFILGFGAKFLKSDLAIPGNVSKFIAIYLMMAIGYKGGYALSQQDMDLSVLMPLAGGIGFSFILPFVAFLILGLISIHRATDRAAIAAHYGSVSVVTFVTATEFLNIRETSYDGWMVAVMAAMEIPAIFAGLILVNKFAQDAKNHVAMTGAVWREIMLNGSIVILVGAFVIGYLAGADGMAMVSPFFVDIFRGVLCLFMVDIGMVAAGKIGTRDGKISLPVIAFGIFMPLIGALCGGLFATMIGMTIGNAVLLSVLCASASYIAVPAALRIAMPNANLSLAICMSLAITFPFNIIVGIPLYFWMVERLSQIVAP